ncbi:hypothetical protein Godav_021505 [Gossypium davidsonii]|uniref:Uncharacterized protein n=2 Tax=Gossypium TaxID=3633 RepID=A0A7J8R7C4_GOSDV|nr:hypothetical protein [Gossypium davidsonii]MBA0644496.1 hypothetical protein [Gossypium klotzschianum]
MWRFRLGSSTWDMRGYWIRPFTCIKTIQVEAVYTSNTRVGSM